MKSIIHPLALLLLLSVGLGSCSQEETLPGISDATRYPMTITVTDGGYTGNTPGTRAAENGYATTFTAGDQIGLYIVNPDGTYAARNLRLTLTNVGGTLTWQTDADTYLWHEKAGVKYFAYYPYQSSLAGAPTAPTAPATTTTDATAFFTGVIAAWTPATDQSTHAKYTAQDLMIGSSSVRKLPGGTLSLSFTMTHTMALMVIEIPITKYTLSVGSYSWAAESPATQFYSTAPGTYRYLVRPAQTGATPFYGSYFAAGGIIKEYLVSPDNIAAATYVINTVDGGNTNTISISHTLQAGDFFLKDGSLVGKDATLTAAQQAACIGIVFKAGQDHTDTGTYTDGSGQAMSPIHGYVLALQDAANHVKWDAHTGYVSVSTSTVMNDWQGYSNCRAIQTYAQNNGRSIDSFEATYQCLKFGSHTNDSQYAAPSGSSGWFLPSTGQLSHIYASKALLSDQLAKLKPAHTGAEWFATGFYWSSSENPTDGSSARYVSFDDGSVSNGNKSNDLNVRSIFVF